MKFHHIGIACKNIKKEIEALKKFHTVIRVSGITYDDLQKSDLCMVTTGDGLNIELVSGPQTDDITKRGSAYYHICYSVNDIDGSVKEFIDKGALLVSPPKPAILFDKKKVAFLMLPYGLIEFVEK